MYTFFKILHKKKYLLFNFKSKVWSSVAKPEKRTYTTKNQLFTFKSAKKYLDLGSPVTLTPK